MNDFYGYIVHQDRMADFTQEADQSRLAAQVTRRARSRRHPVGPRRLAIVLVAVLAGILMLATSSPNGAAPARLPAAPILA